MWRYLSKLSLILFPSFYLQFIFIFFWLLSWFVYLVWILEVIHLIVGYLFFIYDYSSSFLHLVCIDYLRGCLIFGLICYTIVFEALLVWFWTLLGILAFFKPINQIMEWDFLGFKTLVFLLIFFLFRDFSFFLLFNGFWKTFFLLLIFKIKLES